MLELIAERVGANHVSSLGVRQYRCIASDFELSREMNSSINTSYNVNMFLKDSD